MTAYAHLVGAHCGDQQNPLDWYKKDIELFTEFKECEQDDEFQYILTEMGIL